MAQESRRERERRIASVNAREGFAHGFIEGGRYSLALIMGLPRPSEVVEDDDLELGTVQIRVAVANPLQAERMQKLGEFLEAIRETDIKTASDPDEEISPARRLEQIVLYCTRRIKEMEEHPGREWWPSEIADDILTEVIHRANGKHRE